jgi:uncharacterized protein (TIGR03118 family)
VPLQNSALLWRFFFLHRVCTIYRLMHRPRRVKWLRLGALVIGVLAPSLVQAGGFVQTNLVSDVPGLAANLDPNLKNPWGISLGPMSPFWVSDQVTGVATIYNGSGALQALVVTIPGGNPTGQIFNSTADFIMSTGGKAIFLFATLDGNIAGWNGSLGTTAQAPVLGTGAVYTGLALANNGSGNFLYAANNAGGSIHVFNGVFAPTTLAGSFTDPGLPAGYTPYNIQNLGGTLYVTYESEALGGGVVDAFDADGNFVRRISANGAGGPLEAPWGLAIAPAGFGEFGGALLVGNEDDGHISAFDPTTGAFLGQLLDENGQPIANTGLWGLTFGNDGNGGDVDTLYFAAGINEEVNGLFGSIRPLAESEVPQLSSLALLGVSCVGLLGWGWRYRSIPRSA